MFQSFFDLTYIKMKTKVSSVVLCIFGVFVITQGMTVDLRNVQRYYKCWIYAQCYSDGPAGKEFGNCITNHFTPKILNETYTNVIKPAGNYKSDTYNEEVKEMCSEPDDERRQTYKMEMDGFTSYVKNVCNDPDQKELCSRLSGFARCVGSLLDRLRENDQCKIDGPLNYLVSVY